MGHGILTPFLMLRSQKVVPHRLVSSTWMMTFLCVIAVPFWKSWILDSSKLRFTQGGLSTYFPRRTSVPLSIEPAKQKRYPLQAVSWINLREEGTRATSMRRMLNRSAVARKATRIEATTVGDVSSLIAQHKLRSNATLVESFGNVPHWKAHSQCMFKYSEVACLLSHLRAIRQAYLSGHNELLVLEDDVILESDFAEHLNTYVKSAPLDWEILQLWTNNQVVLEQNLRLSDPFVSWQPEHWGTLAYLINRAGMEKILAVAAQMDEVWGFSQPCLMLADELIYYSARTYTATRPPGIRRGSFPSKIQNKSTIDEDIYAKLVRKVQPQPLRMSPRNEKVLVIQNIFVTDANSSICEVNNLKVDVAALASWHPDAQWKITVVTPPASTHLQSLFVKLSGVRGVQLIQATEAGRYNKYKYVKPWLREIGNADLVLLKDSDQRIAGFPWNTFIDAKGDAVVAGPLRQATEDWLMRSYFGEKRQWFRVHDAGEWKAQEVRSYTLVRGEKVRFLEMYFTIFEGKFLAGFLKRILTDEFTKVKTSWGPDYMWCAAAADYDRARPACMLIPVTSLHGDTRTIDRPTFALRTRDDTEDWKGVVQFEADKTLKRWMRASEEYRRKLGGPENAKAISHAFSHVIPLRVPIIIMLVTLGSALTSFRCLGKFPRPRYGANSYCSIV